MSGFGLAGFGTGFIQGFDAMGSQLAKRGLMQREAEQSRRLDRTLALEEELKRQEAARLERSALSQDTQRDLETDILREKFPYVADSAKAQMQAQQGEVESQNLRNDLAKRTMGSAVGTAESQAAIAAENAKRLQQTTPDYVATSGAARREATAGATAAEANAYVADNTKTDKVRAAQYAADSAKGQSQSDLAKGGIAPDMEAAQLRQVKAGTEGTEVGTAGRRLDNQSKKLEVDQAQRREDQRLQASQAWERLDRGEGSPDDVRRIYPLLGAATNPEHERDAELIFQTVQAAAQNKGDVEVFNQPEVLGALNRTFGETVNVTRGMPVTNDGQYVAKDTRIVKMIKHPTDNLIGFEVQVQPEASPERRAQIEQAMQKATPAQREQLMAELNPQPYQSGLTNQRTPVAQGGQMRWFSPQEVQKMVMGLKGISDLRASKPEAIQAMTELKRRIDAGELNAPTDPKALETEIKVRAENRANRAEMRQIEGDTRTAKKEKRAERGDAFNEAAGIIDKQYATVDPLTGMSSFQGDSGQKAADEKLMVDKVLRRNPNMSGAQALEKARRIMARQGKSPAATAAQSGTTGGRKDYSSLW